MSDFTDNAHELLFDPKKGIYLLKGTELKGSRLKRLLSLGIPRVYLKVWLSRSPKSKIQAIALDSKGRKQYYYSKEWQSERETKKTHRLSQFVDVIPQIKKISRRDKQRKGFPREKTMAYMLDIVMETNIRIGNKKYLDKYNSYGLSTLKKQHVFLNGNNLTLKFIGKHSVEQSVTIKSRPIINFIRKMLDAPEDWLMKYQSGNNWYRVSAQDLNNYLHKLAGPTFTIKDYRTWGANVEFVETLCKCPLPETQTQSKKNINHSLESTANKLGNNKSTSKNSYVMDYIIQEYQKNPNKVKTLGLKILK